MRISAVQIAFLSTVGLTLGACLPHSDLIAEQHSEITICDIIPQLC